MIVGTPVHVVGAHPGHFTDVVGWQHLKLINVHAGAECPTVAGQHDDPNAVVAIQLREGFTQFSLHHLGQRIHFIRTHQSHHGHVLPGTKAAEFDLLEIHAVSLALLTGI
ncbi:hypothetical protein D3C85_1223680 [compost metagenome]